MRHRAPHVTICECQPPRREDIGPEWTRFPIARLCYTKKTELWTLHWWDRRLKFHRYQALSTRRERMMFLDPSPHIQDLLDHVRNGGDPICWVDTLLSVMR